ncbi:aldehyde dehydrogenase [Rhizobium straminoryzae]|uniref:Aldehyde dehydrogenase n=1 Tax=Rhizobium straminoryzae TaxID=1387186 RepID=A0A549TF86_9HYPH|nr:aldehyde dehydrogenase [Rhizobium straminoryzae]TRL41179.1 aldehyde dehydrogenase [Rhizobium straminoryzae]
MSSFRDQLIHSPLTITGYVGGTFLKPSPADEIPVIDPTTERRVATLLESSVDEVDRAVTAARAAFDRGPWRRLTVAERQTALMAIHDVILAHADELAMLETINTGIPLSQTRNVHIPRAAYNFRFFAEYINQAGGEVFTQEPGLLSMVTYEPIGVCALIGPWNMPLGLTAMKIAGALAFGNTCVVKPSELTPLTVTRLMERIEGVLPQGVINLVNGRGQVTGHALVSHPGIDMVSFTGGTVTGAAILTALAKGIKGSAMELGGKSANIVFADADFDRALDAAMMSSFMNNGQMCLAGSRIFVDRRIADRFIDTFSRRVAALRIGDPLADGTEVGPMINHAQRERMTRYAESGLSEGASLLAGGHRYSNINTGYFFEPTAMLAPSNDIAICREEIFGPFAALQIFDDEEEVIAKANESDFGLVGYVWTQDLDRSMRAAAALRTGTVLVNTPIVRDLRTGFGGYKQSGLGREGAKGSQAMFTEMKTTIVAREPRRMPRMGLAAS